ncbi:MAG: hypothetical protein WBE34_12585 [Candidatus Nitrosopolaris sp.]
MRQDKYNLLEKIGGWSNNGGHTLTGLFGVLRSLHHFVKEPFAALCLVQNIL